MILLRWVCFWFVLFSPIWFIYNEYYFVGAAFVASGISSILHKRFKNKKNSKSDNFSGVSEKKPE